ncbi:MAG: SDR family NAD(P)-dependent oxidoreductase [Verrucomicrobiales bacterium]|nr:SDR family NAD(P)-dependent oxidoreductase [Verrucomicrobiales bacterium]
MPIYRLASHYLKGMLDRKEGRVIFISSESGIKAAPEMAHYSATKTMPLGISRALAGLTVNSALPGPTLTEGVQKFIAENRPASLIQRLIKPQEIGDIVTFVSSSRAAVINGSNIRAEGGMVQSAF